MADWNDIRRRAQAPVTPPQHGGIPGAERALGLGQAAYSQGMGAQTDVYRQLQDQAAGRGGPSQAQLLAQQQGQQGVVNQLSLTSQGRGGSLAAQQRQAQGIGAAAQMNTAQQVAQLRQQEQAQALQMIQGQANTMGGQGLQQLMGAQQGLQGIYGQQYAGQLQADMANQQAAADQLERNRALLQQGLKMGLGGIANIGTMGAMGALGGAF
jgi:hypothetical protein